MSGGLLQLVAYGAQDVYLSGNPQITFFKSVYRRHTNFAIENIECNFNGKVDFGQKVTCPLPRNGDLVHRIHLKIDIKKTVGAPVAHQVFGRFLGLNMIEYVTVEIGGQEIDKHYAAWMLIWNELTVPRGKKDGYHSMIGANNIYSYSVIPGVDGLGFPNAYGNTDDFSLYVPLNFWFCENPGLALPLIAMQYHEVKIFVKFRELGSWFCGLQDSGHVSLDLNTYLLKDCFKASLLVDYIYLDTDERRRFAQTSHEYLIEEVQYNGATPITTSTASVYNIPLTFNHPVKELFWLALETNNYLDGISTTSLYYPDDFTDLNEYSPTIDTVKLQLNGHDRFAERKHDYFRLAQTYQNHTNSEYVTSYRYRWGRGETIRKTLIYGGVYSFATYPEQHQPSGTLNFSRIDTARLVVKTNDLYADGYDDNYNLHVFARSYNVLRIMSGMAGKAYSN